MGQTKNISWNKTRAERENPQSIRQIMAGRNRGQWTIFHAQDS